MRSLCFVFAGKGRPGADVHAAPTMPLAPRMLSELSAMCMEPPLPLQKPSALPNSSANMRLVSPPLAMQMAVAAVVGAQVVVGLRVDITPMAMASSPL